MLVGNAQQAPPTNYLFEIDSPRYSQAQIEIGHLADLQKLIRSSSDWSTNNNLQVISSYIEERARKIIAGKAWPDGSTYDKWNFKVTQDGNGRITAIEASVDGDAAVKLH
jgi:hypothetical protein